MFTNLRQRVSRRAALVALAAAVAVIPACDSQQAFEPSPSPEITRQDSKLSDALDKAKKGKLAWAAPGLQLVKGGLQWDKAIDEPITRSFVVTDKKGGDLKIKELGFKIEVPRNALDGSDSETPLTITVTALPGKTVAYSFQPHGIEFLQPLSVEQDLKPTKWKENKLKMLFSVGYFEHDWQLLSNGPFTLINEFLPAFLDGDELHWDIWHFSGYMVSTD